MNRTLAFAAMVLAAVVGVALLRSTPVQGAAPGANASTSIVGQLVDPDGKPLADTKMALTISRQNMWQPQLPYPDYVNGKESNVYYSTTDAEGRFSFPAQKTPYLILVFTDNGYLLARKSELKFPLTLKLTRWARLEGQLTIGGKPAAVKMGVSASYEDSYRPKSDADDLGPWPSFGAQTDEHGHFVIERVLAGGYRLSRVSAGSAGVHVAVDAPGGKTTAVEIPILGRSVKGKIVPPKELAGVKYVRDYAAHLITPTVLPQVTLPENMLGMTPPQRLEWYNNWEKTDAGLRHVAVRTEKKQERDLTCMFDEDGTFAFGDVRPGKSFVEVHYNAPTAEGSIDFNKMIAMTAYEFTAPAFDGSDLSTLDVGTLQPRAIETVNAGQVAPNLVFETQTGSGQLADQKGKVMLLDFWGVWCGQCMFQMPELRAIHDQFGSDPHFAMVSLSAGDERKEWEQAIRKEKMTWTQGILGPHENAWQAKMYATSGYPTYWVIGPDGRVIASGWQCKQLMPYIEEALKKIK